MIIIKLKVMPTSPEDDLNALELIVKKKLEDLKAEVHSFERQPIAFGLNALVFTVLWPDKKSGDIIEEEVGKLEKVQSAEIIDVRKAIG